MAAVKRWQIDPRLLVLNIQQPEGKWATVYRNTLLPRETPQWEIDRLAKVGLIREVTP